MQRVHFQVWVGVFSCQQILTQISFVIFDIVVKTNSMSFSLALVKFHWLELCFNWIVILPFRMQKMLLVYYYSENQATSRIWNVLSNMIFPPIWGEKMAKFWACACKLSWTLFSTARVQPLYGAGGKGSSGTGLSVAKLAWCNVSLYGTGGKIICMALMVRFSTCSISGDM